MLFYANEPKRLDSASPLLFFFFFLSFDIDDDGDASFSLLLGGFMASRSILLPCCWSFESERCCVVEGEFFDKGSSRAIATPLSWFVRSLVRLAFGCGLGTELSIEERGERAV